MVDVCSPFFSIRFLKFTSPLIFSTLKRVLHTSLKSTTGWELHNPLRPQTKTLMIPKDLFITRAKELLKGSPMNCFMETVILNNDSQELQAQLYWSTKDQYMAFSYTPELAPCREVFAKGSFIQLHHVFDSFPEDRGLEIVAAQCYIGTLKKDKSGHLALLGPNAITEQEAQALMNLLKQS